ncbi:MAG: hypothetical protein R2762_27735 [Bryobacteraceae bacterium]
MSKRNDLHPQDSGNRTPESASDPRQKFEQPKLTFIQPKLTRHGNLTEVTAGFFGIFSP